MILLQGVVGSTAYGLAREGSDVDRLGVFVAPTIDVAGLHWHNSKETKHSTSDEVDITLHEVGKFIHLAVKGNPTVMELLWLNDYEILEPYGAELVAAREAFLSTKAVANAYVGYATSQASKLKAREDAFTVRRAKHGRHMLRLLRQGSELLLTGRLNIKVDDPEEYWAFDDMTVERMLEIYEAEVAKARMAEANSILPAQPDMIRLEDIFFDIRMEHLID